MVIGAYYLHTNGDLIWKPAAAFHNTSIEKYFDSDFVVKYWVMPEESPTGNFRGDIIWTVDFLFEAWELSIDKKRIIERARKICKGAAPVWTAFKEKVGVGLIGG